MEGIVAKRTLKRSYCDDNSIFNIRVNNSESDDKKIKQSFREKLLFKMAIQTVTVIAGLSFSLAVNFLDIKVVKKSEFVTSLKTEWNKNYTYKDIEKYLKKSFRKVCVFAKPIVPDKLEEFINNKLLSQRVDSNEHKNNSIDEDKKDIENVINKEVEIYEESNNSESEDKEIEKLPESIGTSVEKENQVITAMSSLSYQDEIIANIKNIGITFIKPVSGSITSNFGAREEIFEGVDSYHTGTDIGAKSGTKVVSSISGTVTVATYNKYNGNYVEVKNGDVVTKYLHLSKISVKKGASVKAGEKIGEVGSTGLSTGPHLHFEVVYKGSKIDPRLVVNL